MLLISMIHVYGQSYLIQQNQFNSLQISHNYQFYNNTYIAFNPYPQISTMDAIWGTLTTLQSRYDYAHLVLSTEYKKLMALQLTNKSNIETLKYYQRFIKDYSDRNFRQVDVSIYENYVSWLKFITQPYAISSIKSELSLLQSIDTELQRIKISNPDGFYKSDRYKDITNAMSELSTINKDSISTIAWKYGFIK